MRRVEYIPKQLPDWLVDTDAIALEKGLLPGSGQCSCPRGPVNPLVFNETTVHMMSLVENATSTIIQMPTSSTSELQKQWHL